MRQQYLLLALFFSCLLCNGQDSLMVTHGTITVARPKVFPYIVVTYSYNLVSDKKIKGREGSVMPVKLYDTTGSYRVLTPRVRLSDFLVKKIQYNYSLADTPHVDTLRTVLLITSAGKLKKVLLAESENESNKEIEKQFVTLMSNLQDWDKAYKTFEPGGLIRKKSFFRNEKFYPRDFNVEALVIFSSSPQTADQRTTGRRYDVGE